MSTRLRDKLGDYWLLMRLDKPIGIWLLLWPTLWGLWLAAGGVPPLDVLLVFVAGTVLMRSAGCVINDFADRDFDPHVARTQQRPIAAGRVAPREALLLFAGLCAAAFSLLLQLRPAVMLWSVPAVLLAASYPFAKRVHGLPQAHLGLAFAWGIPMGFVALRGEVDWQLCLPLMAATVCWAIAYDSFYAIVDREDDLKIGVKSSAILFGRYDRFWIAVFQLLSLLLLAHVGDLAGLGAVYYGALGVAALLAGWQQWLAASGSAEACFRAFLNNHYFGLSVFIGVAMDLYWSA